MTRVHRVAVVFVDTSAFFAFADHGDQSHRDAVRIRLKLLADKTEWFTSNLVVAEAHGLFIGRAGIKPGAAFLRMIESGSISVVRATIEDEARAKSIVFQYDDKDFSLTDATSFAIMERLSITDSFTFDRHFEQFGFTLLRANA